MPELPEVETAKRGLAPFMEGSTLTEVIVRERRFRKPVPKELEKLAQGQKILSIHRRAKYLLIDLTSNYTIIIHLGMSGNITLHTPEEALKKHDHVIFNFTTTSGKYIQARLNDHRRFGLVDITHTEQLKKVPYIKSLGVEPLTDEFTGEYLHNHLKKRRLSVKTAIMDSKIVVGVGNIYASEALFLAKICPTNVSNSISRTQCDQLAIAIKKTLKEAILAGGSTLKDHLQSDGSSGYFQHNFKVYGREKEPCGTCNTSISKIVLGQRSSFYCSSCQK